MYTFINRDSRKAFTLIEMLIVIAIIGILASVVLVGLGPLQRRGRDARRQSDLRQVQNALELYFNKCGHYPGTEDCGGAIGTPDWDAMANALTNAGIGINQVPNDPSSSGGSVKARNYQYATDADGTMYVLQAELEDKENPSLKESMNSDEVPSGISGVSCRTTDGEYCISL